MPYLSMGNTDPSTFLSDLKISIEVAVVYGTLGIKSLHEAFVYHKTIKKNIK